MNHKTVNRKGANKKQSIFPPAGGDLRQKIHFWFTIAVMVLIFVHSAMPADLSSRESGVVVAFLMEHLNEVFGELDEFRGVNIDIGRLNRLLSLVGEMVPMQPRS